MERNNNNNNNIFATERLLTSGTCPTQASWLASENRWRSLPVYGQSL